MPVVRDERGRFVTVSGLGALAAKLQQMQDDLKQKELGMRDATLLVTRDAKIFAPVDTGRLSASILPSIVVKKFPPSMQGIVGSAVEYAPAQEARRAVVPTQKPPKGGQFLKRALEKNIPKIKELIGKFVAKIVRK